MHNNVLLITIDSLRWDAVGHLGGELATLEALDRLAADGVSCPRAYANGIPTYYAFRALLTGRRALDNETPVGVPDGWQTIAEWFACHGYDTVGINAGNIWLTDHFDYDAGFDRFEDFIGASDPAADATRESGLVRRLKSARELLPADGSIQDLMTLAGRYYTVALGTLPTPPASVVTDVAIEWLNERQSERPFFLWLHYMDPHYPWLPKETSDVSNWELARTWHRASRDYGKAPSQLDTDLVTRIRRLYADEVSAVDVGLQRLLTGLSERGLDDETVVCVASDHGTELGDRGRFGHPPASLYEELIRVPVVFSSPDVEPATVLAPVQHSDVATTLFDWAGLSVNTPAYRRQWVGDSVLEIDRDVAVTEVFYDFNPATDGRPDAVLAALVEYPWKLHANMATGERQLFNLESDPGEATDVADGHPEVVGHLCDTLRDVQLSNRAELATTKEMCRIRTSAAALKNRGVV